MSGEETNLVICFVCRYMASLQLQVASRNVAAGARNLILIISFISSCIHRTVIKFGEYQDYLYNRNGENLLPTAYNQLPPTYLPPTT